MAELALPDTVNGMKRGEPLASTEIKEPNSITNNKELADAGVLWTQTSKSGNKYWSGKVSLSKMLDHLVSNNCNNPIPEKTLKAMEQLSEAITEDQLKDLDLIMFPNKYRREGKKDPTLNIFAKVSSSYQQIDSDDLPE